MKNIIITIVALLQLKGIGRKSAFEILEAAGPKRDQYNLAELLKHYADASGMLKDFFFTEEEMATAVAKAGEILACSKSHGVSIICYYDGLFPQKLKNIPNPPLLLNFKGDFNILKVKQGIAVVGMRLPNDAGMLAGRYFGKALAERNFNIISGLALGCDQAAHEGAVSVSGGTTTAILAHGLDRIYPPENARLANDIISTGGLLLSEYLCGTQASAGYFVERDRLQAGLADATIVIQTAEAGGTMHAVRHTLRDSKKLAAVSYKDAENLNEKIKGNLMLLKDKGAFALTSENLDQFLMSV